MATAKKPLRIMGLKRIHSEKNIFSFGVCCVAGLLFNGFTYNRDTGSIMPPALVYGERKFPLVKGFGVHWKRLKLMVEEELESDGN
jgi:hypothetical protein